MKKEIMSPERLRASLAIYDLTDSANGRHAINLVIANIETALRAAFPSVSLAMVRKDPRVTVRDNFDDLLFPQDNAGRSSRYTRYISEDLLLRTHTSSAVPGWLRSISSAGIPKDVLALFPGMCYRRDVVDKTHCGEPHQMDVWRVKAGAPELVRHDMVTLVETILKAVVPGKQYRLNEVIHPYTMNGLEVEVSVDGSWLEVMECGEANRTVLANAGLDPCKYSGLALGMGLDRLVMIVKGIEDIRILRSVDPRIRLQMADLQKYAPVSSQPSTKRVLSYSVSAEKTEEDACEEIRDALGENAAFVERIEYSEIAHDALDPKARLNLGIRPDQKNAVVTLVFRSLDRSLPKAAVNRWMQQIYPRLNEGDKGYM